MGCRIVGWLAAAGLVFAMSAAAQAYPVPPAANRVLWLKADAGVLNPSSNPAANGERVNAWLDQSGQGNNGAPTTVNFQPTYHTNVVNGQPAVDFATIGPGGGLGEWPRIQIGAPLLTGTTDFAVITAFRLNVHDGLEHVLGGNYGSGGGNAGLEFRVYLDKLSLFVGGAGVLFSTQDIQANTWYIVEAERSGNVFTQRINNVDEGTFTSAAGIVTGLNWAVGNAPNYSVRLNGDIAEQLVYTDNLATFPRYDALGYLSDKYGIALSGIPEPASGVLLLAAAALATNRRFRGRRG